MGPVRLLVPGWCSTTRSCSGYPSIAPRPSGHGDTLLGAITHKSNHWSEFALPGEFTVYIFTSVSEIEIPIWPRVD